MLVTVLSHARTFLKLYPQEWALFAFVLFVSAFAGPRVFGEWHELASPRTLRIFVALMLVATLRAAWLYWRTPWPIDFVDRPRRLHRALLPAALMPGLFAASAMPTSLRRLEWHSLEVMFSLGTAALQWSAFAAPALLLWSAVGLDLKRERPFSTRSSLTNNAFAAWQHLRVWAPLLLLLSGYAWMSAVIGQQPANDFDTSLATLDTWLLFGHDSVDVFSALVTPWLSEWLAFVYSAYVLLIPLCLAAIYYQAGLKGLFETAQALTIAFVIGYICYALIPVKGPLLARTHFEVDLGVEAIAAVQSALMDERRITYDCFPSMHTAATLLLAWGCHRHARRVFWAIAPIAASIPFACVYLRYHYLVDVLAGVLLAVGVAAMQQRCFGAR